MFNFGIGSIEPSPWHEDERVALLLFRCGCRVLFGKCSADHGDGPCGMWTVYPGLSEVCTNHLLIVNDQRSLN